MLIALFLHSDCVSVCVVSAQCQCAVERCLTAVSARQEFVPRLACGTVSGSLVVLDVARGCVAAELAAHSGPVRGLEWCSLTTLLSWARPAPAAAPARNELLFTDLRTGQSVAPRGERADAEPIAAVRVSPLKQYFIVTFGEQPAELWELASLTPLRTLPGKFPALTALEWSPVHSARRRAGSGAEPSEERPLVKEHFVFTDPAGQMYHFSVEGSQVRDGTRIPADPGVSTVSGIAWKGDQVSRQHSTGLSVTAPIRVLGVIGYAGSERPFGGICCVRRPMCVCVWEGGGSWVATQLALYFDVIRFGVECGRSLFLISGYPR